MKRNNDYKNELEPIIDRLAHKAKAILDPFLEESGFDYSKFKKSPYFKDFSAVVDELKLIEKQKGLKIPADMHDFLTIFLFNEIKKLYPQTNPGEGGAQDLLKELELGYGIRKEKKFKQGSNKLSEEVTGGQVNLGDMMSDIFDEVQSKPTEVIEAQPQFKELQKETVVSRFVKNWIDNVEEFVNLNPSDRERALRKCYEEIQNAPKGESRDILKEQFKVFYGMLPKEMQREILKIGRKHLDERKIA